MIASVLHPSTRYYQYQAIESTLDAIASGNRSALWVMPTGTGKTRTASELIRLLQTPSLFLVHREQLVLQTVQVFQKIFGPHRVGTYYGKKKDISSSIYINNNTTNSNNNIYREIHYNVQNYTDNIYTKNIPLNVQNYTDKSYTDQNNSIEQTDTTIGYPKDVVVASVQSLHEKALETIRPDAFGLVMADEAHHAAAESWKRILDYFAGGGAFIQGMTATPDRMDGKGLAEIFGETPVYEYSLLQAIKDRYLSDLQCYTVSVDTSLDTVGMSGKDFNETELAKAVNTPARNEAIIQSWKRYGEHRKTIVFTVNIQHAEDLATEFCNAGIDARLVHSKLHPTELATNLQDHKDGKYPVLVNCMILTEGYDDPSVSCVIMARPTKSRALFAQCIGRGLRRAKGKFNCILLDITDNTTKHKLVTVANLFGAKKRKSLNGQNITDVLEEEEREEKVSQEKIIHDTLLEWRANYICPWPFMPTLEGYEADRSWMNEPATPKQLTALKRIGLQGKAKRSFTKGEAAYILGQAMELSDLFPAPPSEKQEWYLRFHGLWEEGMDRKKAGKIIGMHKSRIDI